jgi:hypothetical protein
VEALRELRAARRRRYVAELNRMEVLYRIYLAVIFGGWGLALLAGVVDDARVGAGGLDWLRLHAAAVLGLVLSLLLAGALRSGARGGLLALEAADVQYPLLAPIGRRLVLRGPVVRQLRSAVFFGLVGGLVVAYFAYRRLPGAPLEWLLCLGSFGALVPALTVATSLLAAGRRLRPAGALALSALLVGWSLADLLLGLTTSPATMLGELATLPLHSGSSAVLAAVGVAAAAALGAACLVSLDGLSLELARQRSALAAELRFAATVQDLRTVVLLRRQLAAEGPRRRPWLPLSGRSGGRVVWRRDWQSFLRWPAARLARLLLLGVAAGLAAAGAWSGTTPLAALPGPLLLIAALDAIEPLAQEAEHPTLSGRFPVARPDFARRHLPASAAMLAVATTVAIVTALACDWSGQRLLVVLLAAVPVSFLLVCMAAWSATNDPFAYVLVPELQVAMSLGPFAGAATAGGLVVLLAREGAERGSPAADGVSLAIVFLLFGAGIAYWIGLRLRGRLEPI